MPILENLQDMQRLSRLPFRQWVVPDPHDDATNRKIYHDFPPPVYARFSGFMYPLSAIFNDEADAIYVDPSTSCDNAKFIDDATRTGLDAGQCKALIAALNREFAFMPSTVPMQPEKLQKRAVDAVGGRRATSTHIVRVCTR